jgi:hypothetical protein
LRQGRPRLATATATVAPLVLVLYIIEPALQSGNYQWPGGLWIAPAVISMWRMRIWLLANRCELDDDPVVFAIKDRQSIGLGLILAIGFGMAAPASPEVLTFLYLQACSVSCAANA